MINPIILDFDQSVGNLENATTFDLTSWQDDIRFGCSKTKFHNLEAELKQLLPEKYGTVFMGSGDFHHISLLLIKHLQHQFDNLDPIEVVIFDNHPDNMRYLFGIHCGSWVSYVANLPFVSHVHVIGITSNDIGWAHLWENRLKPLINNKLTYWCMDVDVKWAHKLGLSKAFRRFDSPDELIVAFLEHQYHNSSPIYLSIDKDVLSEEIIQTNWDQGCLQTYHILDTISSLKNRIIASDITGEVSTYQYKNWLKRLLSSFDKQPALSADTITQWQAEHRALNIRLLKALQNINHKH